MRTHDQRAFAPHSDGPVAIYRHVSRNLGRILLAASMYAACMGASCLPVLPQPDAVDAQSSDSTDPQNSAASQPNPLGVNQGQVVYLDGSGPGDPLGDGQTFVWEQFGGPMVTLEDANTAKARFVAPRFDADTLLSFRLTSSNGDRRATRTVGITVLKAVDPPTADLLDFTAAVVQGAPLAIDFTVATPDGKPAPDGTYAWDFGDTAKADGVQVRHVYAKPGTYVVTLCATVTATTTTTGCREKQIQATQTKTIAGDAPFALRSISGHVTSAGNGVAGCTVTATSGATAATDGDGFYRLMVPDNWTGAVTVALPDYAFEPASRSYVNVAADQLDGDFVAKDASAGAGPQEPPPPPANSPPMANDLALSTAAGTDLTITLAGADPDDNALAFTVVAPPAHGTLSAITRLSPSTAKIIYSPEATYGGDDAFTYKANDGLVDSDAATVRIQVGQPEHPPVPTINNPPVADHQTVSTVVNTPVAVTLTGTDPEAQPLIFELVSQPAHGSVAAITPADGTYATAVYTPVGGYVGADAFTFRVNDGAQASGPATVDVAISGQPPASVPISGQVRDYNSNVGANVSLIFTGTGSSTGVNFTAATGADGKYQQAVPYGWSGMVTPDSNYRFEPASHTYTAVTVPQTAHNYVLFRNYYIALSGSDSNPGTMAKPFQHFAKFVGTAKPGDTGYVRGGTYNDYVFGMNFTGTADEPITFRSYPGEVVTIDRQNPINSPYPYGIQIGHPSNYNLGAYIIVDGFKIRNIDVAVSVAHAKNVVVRNIEALNCSTGINVKGQSENSIIEDCHVHDCTNVGIAITDLGGSKPGEPVNPIVRRCLIHHMAGTNPDANDGLDMVGVLGGEISYNIVYDTLDDCIDVCGAAGGSGHTGSLHVSVHHNITFLANPINAVGGDGNGIKVSTKAGGDHTVYKNVVFGCNRGGIDQDITPAAPGNYFYNNTVWSTGQYGLILDTGSGGSNVASTVFNNIFARSANNDLRATGTYPIKISDYNLIMDGRKTAAEGPHTRTGDPQLTNPYARDASLWVSNSAGALNADWKGTLAATMDNIRVQVFAGFALKAGGPCVDAGMIIPGVTDGAAGTPDIGALEMGGAW
jgi:hypothetical protein